ncbi:MAG: VCBS repeat-containing protein [Planctomycetes bacterium]|nr:VCBS repeat-containing protein [Planctomycetota bacterium]
MKPTNVLSPLFAIVVLASVREVPAQTELWTTKALSGVSLGDVTGDQVPDFFVTGLTGITVHSGKAPHPQLWSYATARTGARDGVGDLDGDGWPEFAVLTYSTPQVGTFSLFTSHDQNGKFGLVRQWTIRDGYAFDFAGGHDLDGDNYADVAIGDYPGRGYVELVSGKWLMTGTGARTIRVWNGAESNSRFGLAVTMCGDIDGDGVSEVAVAEALNNNAGRVSVYSGQGGQLLRTVDGTTAKPLETRLASLGDVSDPKDGIPDLLLSDVPSSTGTVRVLSGQWVKTGTGPQYLGAFTAREGDRLDKGEAIGDCDGDGWSDYAIASKAGYLAILSGKTHTPIYETRGQGNSFEVARLGDVNGDRVPDFLQCSPFGPNEFVRIISGKILRGPKLQQAAPTQGEAFGGEKVTLTGSDLGAVSELRVGAALVDPATFVFGKLGTTLEFETPMATGLGQVPVLARAGALVSNALSFTYVPTPAPIIGAPFAAEHTKSWDIRWGGPPNAIVALPLIHLDAATWPIPQIKFLGKDVLHPATPTSLFLVMPSNAAGNGSVTIPPLPAALKSRYVWAQTVSFSSSGFDGVSKQAATLVF